MRPVVLTALAVFAFACGGGSSSNPPPDSGQTSGPTIRISGFAFSPADMTVDAGTTITVINADSTPHTVTSESSDNQFVNGSAGGVTFDTGSITAGTSATITIPNAATSGTVVPYFCTIHKQMMSPPNGHITVR